MLKLSEQEYWNSIYRDEKQRLLGSTANLTKEHDRSSLRRKVVRTMKGLLGKKMLERISSYADYLLWEIIFKRHLSEMKGAKVLEVGSAPGKFLVKFSQKYDCAPYGVEYSETGVEVNRKVFSLHGLNPDNVIYADFLSEEFHGQYRESFDVVISRGFIEHFSDVGSVIDRHVDLLVPGGYLVVSIPNLKGINYVLTRIFSAEVIPLHNFEIMRTDAFTRLFVRSDLQHLFCDYYGTFSFDVICTRHNSSMIRFVSIRILERLQQCLNLIFRLLLNGHSAESKLLSPYLLFIGRKR
jgi:2-polyprenyl-3-methyl-5-hydroxy-6-metoxy-1,4-benzoquinol methylase